MAEVKVKFRDELDVFAKKYFGAPIARLNEIQRTDALTLCYLLEIRNGLLPQAVPDDIDELKLCIADGRSDRSVDFIYRDDSGHVTIIQTKHRSPEKAEQLREAELFSNTLKNLCPDTRPPISINQRLLDLISNIEWDTDSFTLIFLSLARHSEGIQKLSDVDLEDVPGTPLADISTRSEFLYLSEDELNKNWRDVVGNMTGTTPSVSIRLKAASEGGNFLSYQNVSGIKSYVTALAAAQIHELYTQHRDRLFNLNIRNYIGDTRTNKGVMESALKEGENFFLYNNGISAVARRVSLDKTNQGTLTLVCHDFSIINGAQTFRSLSKAYSRRSKSAQVKEAIVLLRVTEFDFHKPALGDVLDKVTRFNNTQNSMKLSDFRSNDPVQMSLVRYTSEVAAWNGRKFVYRNKRTQTTERNTNIIKMDEFCRSTYAYQFGPADMYGGLSHLYDTGPDGGYVKLFGRDLAVLPRNEFERLFAIWLIDERAAELLKNEKQQSAATDILDEGEVARKAALERKYVVFYAIGEVVREIARLRQQQETDVLKTYAKPRWLEDDKRRQFIDDAFALACDIVVQVYLARSKEPGFMHRNFFRDQGTLSLIRETKASRRGEFKRLVDQAPI